MSFDRERPLSKKPEDISRRGFLKLLAGSAVVAFTPGCEPTTGDDLEGSREFHRIMTGFESVFHLLPAHGIPERLQSNEHVNPQLDPADLLLRKNVEQRFTTLPENNAGRDLIIQDLGYPHAIHNSALLLERGYDIYSHFSPLSTGNRSDARIVEVMSYDLLAVEAAKQKLLSDGLEQLKGIVLNYDGHDMTYQYSHEIANTFPSADVLRQLGITRLCFIGEFAPSVERQIATDITSGSYVPGNQMVDFIQKCQTSGMEVIVWGIDTRYEDNHQTNEHANNTETVSLEDGTTVTFFRSTGFVNVYLSDGTLLRSISNNQVETIPPGASLSRAATQTEATYYYEALQRAQTKLNN